MIRFDIDNSAAVADWVGSRIPHVSTFGPCTGIAVLNEDRILAGVVYHDYQPDFGTVQLSMAADNPRWAKKEIIAGLLQYPFEQLGCYKVWTATPVENTMALRVNEHIGFLREAVLNSMFGKGRHGVLMRLLKPKYEQLYMRV